MIGSSSTWYAMSAWLRTSRNSSARAAAVAVLEDAKKLLRDVHDGVRAVLLDHDAPVEPPPGDLDDEHAGRVLQPHVERRGSDVRRVRRPRSETLCGGAKRLRV